MRPIYTNLKHGFLATGIALLVISSPALGEAAPTGLEARLHPQSPVSCGIDIIEVGSRDEAGAFLPQLALLQDRYDSSFPDTPPKIRSIYSYAKPPTRGSAPHPVEIAKIGKVKRDILTYVDFKIAATAALFAGPVPGALAVVADSLVNAYKHSREFYRTEALYTLDLLLAQPDRNLFSLVDENALHEAMARAREYSFRGLFIPSDLTQYVWEYQKNERDEQRTQSYANLLSILNREGLIARPLSQDYILVYFDPSQPHPRPVDFQYTDLNGKPLTGTDPIPLGVYALGLSSDRILETDLTATKKSVDRRWVQRLTRFGLQTASIFVPLPLSITLYSGKGGTHFVMQKQGNDLFTSTIHSQAELIALLQSGLVHLDPNLIAQIRSDMVMPGGSDPDQTANFKANARAMTDYLTRHGDLLCAKVKSLREKEYEKTYLSPLERLGRKWNLLWRPKDDPRNATSRLATIRDRHDLVAARVTLNYYDEARIPAKPETIASALALIGPERNPKDARLIGRILLSTTHPEIELAALKAAGDNGNAALGRVLAEYLSRFTSGGNPDQTRLRAALETIDRLHIEGDASLLRIMNALTALDAAGPWLDTDTKAEAQHLMKDLVTEMNGWRNQNESG